MPKLTFFDLLGVSDPLDAALKWPRSAIGSATGLVMSDDPQEFIALMLFLQESLAFTGVRSGTDGDHSGFWAELHVEPSLFALDRPLVAVNLPEFAFVLEATGPLPATAFVTRSIETGAVDVVVQGLPVRLIFPLGYLEPQRTEEDMALPPPLDPKRMTDAFDPAVPDSLEITLGDAESSFIRVRVNARLSADGHLYIDTVVPVSIGSCYLLALPCRAVHDMQLVPAPALRDVPSEVPFEWTRHPFGPNAELALNVVTFRTIDLDPAHPTIAELMKKIRAKRSDAAAVEFVIEDVAVAQPIPWHGRFGLRRAVVTPTESGTEMFNLNNAPARIEIGPFALFIYRLLLQTVPFDGTELPIAVDLSVASDTAAPTGGNSAAVSVDEKGLATATWVLAENLRPRLMTLAGATVHLAAARVGWAMLGLEKAPTRPGIGIPDPVPLPEWADPFIVVCDFAITTGATKKLIEAKPRTESSKTRILHEVGWSLGKVSFGSLSDLNVDFTIAKAFRLRIEEIGFITDADSGKYFVLSASIGTPFEIAHDPEESLTPPSDVAKEDETKKTGFGLRIHRLKFRIGSGEELETRFKLDGLSLWIRANRFELLGFGMVSEFDLDPPGNHYEEMGFALKLRLEALSSKFELGVQFFHGQVSGTDNFTYWMFGFELGVLPLGSMELSQLRVLAVKNMTPRLEPPGDSTAEEMRLLRWFKREGDALSLRLDRKLSAWMPLDASVAGGVGASLTLSGTKAVRISLFAFAFDSPDASGVLIGLELYLVKSKDPVAFAALEWDPETDKWGLSIGVNLSLDKLLGDDAPKWITRNGIGASLSGLFYAGNQPCTLAIGQYNDIATWLALQFQIKVAGKLEISVLAAFCRHRVDRPEGPNVTGLMVQAKGQLKLGVGKLQFYATFSWIGGQWRNEAISAGDVFLIEAGVRIRLFRVFNFGASIHVEISNLGPQAEATYNRKSFKVSVETPWYLPDVTIRWESTEGTPQVGEQSVVSCPLTGASALGPGGRPAQPIGHTFVTTAEASNPERVYALRELHAVVPIMPSDAEFAALTPVSVDSTIVLDCKPSLDAEATPLPATPPDAGRQESSDLAARYVLAAVGVRRRARFGLDAGVWKVLVDPASTVLPALGGLSPVLVDAMAPVVGFDWDADVHREGALDPRRLLVNARTPYSYTIGSAANDEVIADSQPRWPCCERFPKPRDWHRVDWSDTPLGTRAPVSERFTDSTSTFQWLTPRAPIVVAVVNEQHAARVRAGEAREGLLARARFDARAFACEVFMQWSAAHSNVSLVVDAFDGLSVVESRTFSLGAASPPAPIRIERAGGFTSLTVRRTAGSDGEFEAGGSAVAVTLVRYRTVDEERERLVAGARCQAQEDRLAGVRRFAWLPNHDYEIQLRTRVELDYSVSGAQAASLEQTAFFRTKGLPGLNAVSHVGEEVEPYVESRYPRAEDRLYRRELLAIAFNERFNILAPVDRIPVPGSPLEAAQLLEWSLAVEKSVGALGFERVSVTSPDWLTAHRGTVGPRGPRDPLIHGLEFMRGSTRRAASLDPMRLRFEHMQTRTGGCGHPAIAHSSHVLTHDPVDVASPEATVKRWEANAEYDVNLRRKNGPFIERDRFDPLDVTAVRPAAHGGPSDAWTVDDGAFGSPGAGSTLRFARFGEADEVWMHAQLRARVRPNTGAAGLAVALDASGASITAGWVALVERSDDIGTLRLLEIDGAATQERATAPLTAVPAEPTLELIAYDDAIVATVGDAKVSAPRGLRRTGMAALVVRGDAQVTSLSAIALDAYRLVFRTSRYDDFPAQIATAEETIDVRRADAFGAPQTTVAALFARTREEIAAAMRPEGAAEARERLIETWANERALLFRQTPERLSFTRTAEASATSLLIFEGPEALAFSRDVTLAISRRTQLNPVPPGPIVPTSEDAIVERPMVRGPVRGTEALAQAAIRWLARFEWVDDHLIGPPPPRGLEATQRIVTIEAVRAFLERVEYRIVRRPGGSGVTRSVEAVFDRRRRVLLGDQPRMQRGDVLLAGADGPVLPPIRPPFPWPPRPVVFVPQPVVLLTNGDETRGLVIPVNAAGDAIALPSGFYRFVFAIDRPRWRADVPDATSNYRAQVTFDASW